MVVQSDQKIVLAGSTGDGSTSLICVARYDTDGNPDPTFGINGVATTAVGSIYDEGDALAIDADAKILVAGTSNNGAYYEIVVLRYNSDGTLDPSFDGDGVAITNVGGGSIAYAMALQADGKILVGGVGNGANGPDFALVRYNADGTLDISFDGDGMVTTEISAGPDRVNALAVQPDGRIIAVGSFGDIPQRRLGACALSF
ncbi:MAG: hypothetical protein IPG74_09930 [Flavobacteriales bacterium]|nr:hypothetical protein [Flavobacteriales bacterium]